MASCITANGMVSAMSPQPGCLCSSAGSGLQYGLGGAAKSDRARDEAGCRIPHPESERDYELFNLSPLNLRNNRCLQETHDSIWLESANGSAPRVAKSIGAVWKSWRIPKNSESCFIASSRVRLRNGKTELVAAASYS